jgi:predicted Zn-dependent peptidase
MIRAMAFWVALVRASAFWTAGAAPMDLSGLAEKLQEFKLANGFSVAVLERKDAPAVSAALVFRAGHAMNPPGKRGLAAVFEMLLEEGPDPRPALNVAAEKAAFKEVEAAYDRWEAIRRRGSADEVAIQRAEVELKMARERAALLTVPRYARRALEFHGGDNLQVNVGPDATFVAARLPSTRIEAFFLLYGEWMQRPFLHNFYAYRDLMANRAASAAPAEQALQAAIAQAAFPGHPYGNPRMAPAEMRRLRYADAEEFARTYFTASNAGLVLVGDIGAAEARRLAELHFGRAPAGARSILPAVPSAAVRQPSPPEVAAALAVFYPRPPFGDPDDAVFDRMIPALMMGNRSLAWKKLVETDRLAPGLVPLPLVPGGSAGGVTGIAVAAPPGRGVTDSANRMAAVFEELAATPIEDRLWETSGRLIQSGVTDRLTDPFQAAILLAQHIAAYGSARTFLGAVTRLESVTREDVQRAAAKYFTPETRSVMGPGIAPASPADGAGR